MSLNFTSTTLVLLASLTAAIAVGSPATAGEPTSRLECRMMDPNNQTNFCHELFELDMWRLQVMEDTGPTPALPVEPALPELDWAVV